MATAVYRLSSKPTLTLRTSPARTPTRSPSRGNSTGCPSSLRWFWQGYPTGPAVGSSRSRARALVRHGRVARLRGRRGFGCRVAIRLGGGLARLATRAGGRLGRVGPVRRRGEDDAVDLRLTALEQAPEQPDLARDEIRRAQARRVEAEDRRPSRRVRGDHDARVVGDDDRETDGCAADVRRVQRGQPGR